MPAERLEAAFRATRSEGRLALVPFLTAGDPDPAVTVELACALARTGATALELGIPFSDPIADGPVIQESSQRALARGTHVDTVLASVRAIRGRSEMPIVLMTYANPVLRYGAERFARDAAAAGADGVILTDMPPEELPDTWSALRAAGLAPVLLVTPLTRADRRDRILSLARGYVSVVSRTGVTGRGEAGEGLERLVRGIRERCALPVAVGFGIETPEHVRRFHGLSDGVVVGSALVRRIREAGAGREVAAAEAFVRELLAATGPEG